MSWWGSPGDKVMKNPSAGAGDTGDMSKSLGLEDPLERESATHSSVLALEVSWTEEPVKLLTMETWGCTQLSTRVPCHGKRRIG